MGEFNDKRKPALKMTKKRPIIWLGGTMDTPKLASLELKYMKINVLIALVSIMKYSTKQQQTSILFFLPHRVQCICAITPNSNGV